MVLLLNSVVLDHHWRAYLRNRGLVLALLRRYSIGSVPSFRGAAVPGRCSEHSLSVVIENQATLPIENRI